jgi:hypothetical protein
MDRPRVASQKMTIRTKNDDPEMIDLRASVSGP